MPNINSDLQRKAGFYHSLGKVLTEDGKYAGNELYKSAHNVSSGEVWMDSIPFAADLATAMMNDDGVVVRQLGTVSNPVFIYPLRNSNYQTWFIDAGTPSAFSNGFVPSVDWVKPLINPSDVPNAAGAPSTGYSLRMYRPDGTTFQSYDNAFFEVDYFAGLIRFQSGATPIDPLISNGLGFQFSKTGFEAVTPINDTTKKAYIQSVSTGGPRVIAWQYVGQTLDNYSLTSVSFGTSSTISFTQSGPTYSFYINEGSLTASLLNTGTSGGATAGYFLSVDGDGNFVWQPTIAGVSGSSGTSGTSGYTPVVEFLNSDTITFVTQSTTYGLTVSAVIATASIVTSLLATASNGGATAGYILSNTGDGNFAWVPPSTGTQLDVVDYLTGETFSAVSTMIFRGGVVSVPPPGSTATGVLVTGPTPTVTVWIPAPNYAPYFQPGLGSGPHSRYVSIPGTNAYVSTPSAGTYGVGDWNNLNDFNSNTTRNVINSGGSFQLFSDAEFACYTNGTTMSFTLYNHDGTILSEITNFTVNTGNSAVTTEGLSIAVNSFLPDNDRYKANVSGTLAVSTAFPNGGRFNWNITHYNGEGAGNIVAGVYSFSQSTPVFYDNDSPSSANISGTVTFDENTPSLVYYSGVAFYDMNSTFALTASGIDLLNEITIPVTKQSDYFATNMAITGTLDGYADGSKPAGTVITGWTLDWDKSGLTYSRTATVNQTGQYIPGFGTFNLLSTSNQSLVTCRLYDYGLADTLASVPKDMLFDTDPTDPVLYWDNPLDSENGRLSTSGVLTSGSSAFVSTVSLPSDELQYIFGRVIFPQEDFTTYFPSVNFGNSVDYSASTGVNKTYNCFITPLSGSGTTTPVAFNNYRWHVTSYGKDASYSLSFTNAYFEFDGNFQEDDLHFSYGGVPPAPGNADLVILVGVDSSGLSITPDKFLFVSGDPSTYGTRSAHTNNLNSSPKQIKWSKGTLSFTVKKIWLFIGYEDTTRGNQIYMSGIRFYPS
jgi:hypothetical protein